MLCPLNDQKKKNTKTYKGLTWKNEITYFWRINSRAETKVKTSYANTRAFHVASYDVKSVLPGYKALWEQLWKTLLQDAYWRKRK